MGAIALDRYTEKQLRKKGLTKMGLATPLVAQKFAIEAVGLSASYMFFGEEGAEDWMGYSNTVYDWGSWGEIPVAGSVLELFPNPVALTETWMQVGHDVATYKFRPADNIFERDMLSTRAYFDSFIPW